MHPLATYKKENPREREEAANQCIGQQLKKRRSQERGRRPPINVSIGKLQKNKKERERRLCN